MPTGMQIALQCTERGLVPDALARHGIRRLIRRRLEAIGARDCESMANRARTFVEQMDRAEIAPLAHRANEQHYGVPAEFFRAVLGRRLKYSACYWPPGVADLDAAEEAALAATCEHAGLADGMSILELGCGWGSLTLWMAEHYPASRISAVSNSASQRAFILDEAARRHLSNVEVITADMNDFATASRFERVVSVEMFEHMRNYRTLFARVHDWLAPGGRFFMHIFCHRAAPYAFVDEGPSDWMSRHFFSGGIMPSEDLPLRFQEHLKLVDLWRWSGVHYAQTANAWLANMQRRREQLLLPLERTYGRGEGERWWIRWRLFFMACAELFGYDHGQRWWVSHYAFERKAP